MTLLRFTREKAEETKTKAQVEEKTRSLVPPLVSDLCLTSNAASLPHRHQLFDSVHYFLHLAFMTGLLLLRLYVALSVSLWGVFSVGTGCGSAGSRGSAADRLFLGDDFKGSRRPLLLALELKLKLSEGRGLRIGRRLLGMEVSLRCDLGLGLSLGLVHWWCRRLWMGLRLRLLLLLHLDLQRLVVRMMLELWGSGSVFTEATGLSCTVDLTQRVQCLALGMLQQVCLALRDGDRKKTAWSTTLIRFYGSRKFLFISSGLCEVKQPNSISALLFLPGLFFRK